MNVEAAPGANAAASAFQVGDLIIDVRMRHVSRGGMSLDIADRSFDVLLALVRATPNLLSTQELMDRVWGGIIVGPETITQRIKLLRQSLGDSAEKPRYIAVARGRGYRIVAPVAPLAAPPAPSADEPIPFALFPSPAPALDAPVGRPAESGEPGQGQRRWLPALLSLMLLLGVVAIWLGLERHSEVRVAGSGRLHSESSPVTRSSVAVLPFANLTGEPAKDFLGDGMAEELINALAQVPGLKVPARTSTFAYKGHNVDIRRIAQDLGVATVLEGSVRSTGERLRISARLVDAASGYQIWSQDYDRQSADIFKVQDDLAGQIVQALRAYVKIDLMTPPERMPPSTNVQAYELYLQARSISRGTGPSEHQAAALLDQALALDPYFAEALGDRAIIGAASVALAGAPTRLLEGAQRDATRALASDPASSHANTAQELIHAVHGEWVAAELSFRAGMASGDTDPIMRSFHPMILLRPLGRLRAARAELTETYRMAPDDGFTVHELALTDSLLGLDAEAVRLGGISEEISGLGGPPHADVFLVQARAASRAGRFTEATERALLALPERLRKGVGGQAIRAFYAGLADAAKQPVALQALQAFIPTLKTTVLEGRTRMFFIDALVMMGARDEAYELAMWCVGQRSLMPGSIDWSDVWMPEMQPFRKDPRFQVFVQRLRLPDYWAQYGPPDSCDLSAGTLRCE